MDKKNLTHSKIPILHDSVSLGNLECLKALVEYGHCSINDLDSYGRTALFICACEDTEINLDISKYFLDCGIDINTQANTRWYNWTALMTACYYNNKNLVRLLLEYSANYELKDLNGKNAYQIAEDMRHLECMDLLLTKFEYQTNEIVEIEKVLQEAIFNNDYEMTETCLKGLGTKAKYMLNANQTATQSYLYRVCRYGNAQMAKLLVDNGAIARPHSHTKYSPLYIACYTGSIEITSLLLEKFQYLINVETIEYFLPIHACCAQGHLSLIKFLLAYEYDNDLMNMYETNFSNRENFKYLFAFDLNSLDFNEQSMLYTCVTSNNIEIGKKTAYVQLLLEYKVRKLKNSEVKVRKSMETNKLDAFLRKYQSKTIEKYPDVKQTYGGRSSSIFEQFKNFMIQSSPQSSSSINAQIDEHLNVKFTNRSQDYSERKDESHMDADDSKSNITDESDNENDTAYEYLNPFNVDQYTKFGFTCLHEAIRQHDKPLTSLLLNFNADINLPVLDTTNDNRPISNCFIEMIKTEDEDFFLFFFKKYLHRINHAVLIESTIQYSIDYMQTRAYLNTKQYRVIHNILPVLIAHTSRVHIDKDYKLQQLQFSDYNGIYLDMSKFEPKLNELPDIWLNKICSEFVTNYDQTYLTRLDLSQNNLKFANPVIFQLANVKQIKLNGNQIETLCDIKFQSNSLEELDVSANNLNEVPESLFYLKNLKHLNVSSNQITEIPFSIWQCKSLVELNISFNAVNSLPFKCKNFKLLSIPNDSPTVRQQQTCATIDQTINYTQKPLVKINIWNNNCEPGLKNIDDFNLNDELLVNTNIESTDNKSQYYSNLIDLNLSHNNFDDVPACLACLMPKLLKLNMSFNRIKSMGSPNDYPTSLKHLDLSNNQIKAQMTVINMDMLNFFNLNNESKTIIRDYCYLSLTNNQLNVNEQRSNTVTTGRLSLNHQNEMQQQQQQQRNEQKNALIKQQHKRRSRSQSRNTRMFSTVHKDNQLSISIANDQPDLQSKQSQQNLFESFLVNNNLNFLKLIKFDEKSHLNPANIQMYLDKLCVHKKHLKLDNLKTLNLSNNKIVNFKTCLSLLADKPKETVSQQPIDSDDSDTDSDKNPTKKQIDDDKKILKVFYPNLAHLDLSTNLIKSLNGTFSLLENLSYLNVSSNSQLSTISPKLCLLTKLWNFDLKYCLNLSDTVLNGMVTKQRVKTSEILAYLKSIHENSKPYMKLKLMILGVQGIGKTSLLNKLKEETNSGQQAQQQQRFRFSNDTRPIAHTVNLGLNINEWVYEKPSKPMQRTTSTQYVIVQQHNQVAKSFGPITFRTHDFVGQKEYYSTHQYFLSKRCVYLICWKLTDEEKGINEIHTWLLNIQTRAPGSPCILVGTHYDQLYKLKNYKEISNFLQRIIYERFIKPNENEICAYPPIWASIEVSSKTGYNVKYLANIVYDVACQMKVPGCKDQLLFEQKIPITYLILEECINYILTKLRIQTRSPVLTTPEYLKEVKETLNVYYASIKTANVKLDDLDKLHFRNDSEILQATQFLHEYGLLVHYNDSDLRDLYFIDVQWLYGLLSNVLAKRDVNNQFAASKAIVLISDLLEILKDASFEISGMINQVVHLLGKFELALTWDNKHLLIPSLLPSEALVRFSNQDIRVTVSNSVFDNEPNNNDECIVISRSRHNSLNNNNTNNLLLKRCKSNESFKIISNNILDMSLMPQSTSTQFKVENKRKPSESDMYQCKVSYKDLNWPQSLRRLYCLPFMPSGFFSRLMARILSDKILNEYLRNLFAIEIANNPEEQSHSQTHVFKYAQWRCWQTGIELKYLDYTVICIKELINDPLQIPFTSSTQITKNIFVHNSIFYRDCENELKSKNYKQGSFVECYISYRDYRINENLMRITTNQHSSIRILAYICEIIDNLLEDWYPDLGTRFMQDSKGEYLVTRLAPCIQCVLSSKQRLKREINGKNAREKEENDWNIVSLDEKFKIATVLDDSLGTVEPNTHEIDDAETLNLINGDTEWIYCFMLDDICFSVMKQFALKCPLHGNQDVDKIAPDLAFKDLCKTFVIDETNLKLEKLLGRGSFGSVYYGFLNSNFNKYDRHKVAIKSLETVQSRQNQPNNEVPVEQNFLNIRKSIRLCAKAYVLARQELEILFNLKHENIVRFLGICIKPLSIILELAPFGNLKDVLNEYKTNLCYLSFRIVQEMTVQISSALVYLHDMLIIYRDLKSDNILVWKFPKSNRFTKDCVLIKLADYSISRCVLPTGTKGFAGTEGYMSPEIIRYNGEEAYTNKIDCFSFGMLLYEIIALKHPFENNEQIKDIVLNGGRPLIRSQESAYPTLMLDLMCLCWSENPSHRPTSSDINKYCNTYEFSHLLDVSVLEDYQSQPLFVTCYNKELVYDTVYDEEDQIDFIDIWCVKNCVDYEESKLYNLEIITYEFSQNFMNTRKQINVCSEKIEAICLYKKQIWCIDSMKCVYVFCTKTYSKLNQYIITTVATDDEIVTMMPIESIDKIIACSLAGVVIQISATFTSINDDLNFKLLDTKLVIKSAILLHVRHDKSYELWLGTEHAQFHVYNIYSMKLTGIHNHFNLNEHKYFLQKPDEPKEYVTIIKTSANDALFLWSYVCPSSKIFLWNHVAKVIMSTYDLKNIYTELNHQPTKRDFKIVDLNFLNNLLYCGTNTGSIFVFKRLTLTPLYICDVHVKSLYSLCPITFETTTILQPNSSTRNSPQDDFNDFGSKFRKSLLPLTTTIKEQQHVLITAGRALSPIHEDIYLARDHYRFDALKNYDNCLFLCAWTCNENI